MGGQHFSLAHLLAPPAYHAETEDRAHVKYHRYAFRDILYRLKDPRLVASHALRKATHAYDLVSPSEFSRLYRQVKDITMCSNARLRGLHNAVRHVVAQDISGDIVECGTARGGSAALMGLTLKLLEDDQRKLWVFDTFEGLPPPTSDDPDFEIANLYTGRCRGSLEDVTASFTELGIQDQALFIKGLFQETLPGAAVDRIAVLHLDGDWYESVKSCLDLLYDKVVEGGIIQIDDYGFWKGARKAVDEFFEKRSIAPRLKHLDYSGRQFIKTTP